MKTEMLLQLNISCSVDLIMQTDGRWAVGGRAVGPIKKCVRDARQAKRIRSCFSDINSNTEEFKPMSLLISNTSHVRRIIRNRHCDFIDNKPFTLGAAIFKYRCSVNGFT